MASDLSILAARVELDSRLVTDERTVEYLVQNQLDPDRIAGFAGAHGVVEVVDHGRGRFDWSGPGETFPAFVLEVLGEDGETVIDIAAWPTSDALRMLTLFGNGAWLGAWAVWNPATYYLGKPLLVHRSGLSWLKSGCAGAAVLVPRLAARELLDLPGRVAGEDRGHGRELLALAETAIDRTKFLARAA